MTTTIDKMRRPSSVRLSQFARSLLAEWQRLDLPTSHAGVVAAVSGGADSAALMLALEELVSHGRLRVKVVVAHLDHGLRDDSKKDAQWVSRLAQDLGFDVVVGRANLKTPATSKTQTSKARENLEQAARKARYEFLHKTARKVTSEYVLTAHTLDDQAETVLLRLLRGSAAEGLGGTPTVRELKRGSKVKLVRPLLAWARRSETEDYCRLRRITFRVDEMNDDETFSRVRVRKHLLPLMKSFNNRVVEALGRTASLLNEDATALAGEASRLLQLAAGAREKNSETKSPPLSVSVLSEWPAAVRRRALREWILRARGNLNRVEMVHLMAVEKLLSGERGGRVAELPGGMKVTRRRGLLELSGKKELKKAAATSKIQRNARRR
ncbi:MAG TPA: tRNA lysidine(34) synthetase TilS [Pyrinomonadaceae bacterium]|nr:tRNA lysidine(34) synthetase TilS [Pyrinomonadaceae bacterium]